MVIESPDMTTTTTPLLRRNSIATSVVVPSKLTLLTKPHHAASFPNGTTTTAAAASTSSSFSSVEFELISLKPLSYTSLKDLLPSTPVHSSIAAAPGAVQSGYEISIRNRLVKQAAWAYLQPMSASPDSSGRHFLHRLWVRISGDLLKNPLTTFLRFVTRIITRSFDRVLQSILVRSYR